MTGLEYGPGNSPTRLGFDSQSFPKLTHYLFRYPAKFHPPAVRALIERYSAEGDTIVDPFCGSGTLMVEAAVANRNSIGLDVDPVAVFVSRVKTRALNEARLELYCKTFLEAVRSDRQEDSPRIIYTKDDLPGQELEARLKEEDLWIPSIPNINHWFRRHVILDLARLHKSISQSQAGAEYRDFLRLCLASIIRSASNADPVPVSGLEVTAHMKRLEAAGREIRVFDLFEKTVKKNLEAMLEFCGNRSQAAKVRILQADAAGLSLVLRKKQDLVITSPPYHGAVDYYRRHKLEMFWLGFTRTQQDRLRLSNQYLGKLRVPQSHRFLSTRKAVSEIVNSWENRMREVSPERADAFVHYVEGMKAVFGQLAKRLSPGRKAVLVVGHSTWNNDKIPTTELFEQIARPQFALSEILWYPVKNRYMSYSRHNGASIDSEYALVFERSDG